MHYCSRKHCKNGRPSNDIARKMYSELSTHFEPLYILSCGHPICERCIIFLIKGGEKTFKCEICGIRTVFSPTLMSHIRSSSFSNETYITRLNRNCPNDLPIDAYSFGVAFNNGLLVAAPNTEVLHFDEPPKPRLEAGVEAERLANEITGENSEISKSIPKNKRPRNYALVSALKDGLSAHAECATTIRALGALEERIEKEYLAAERLVVENFHNLHCALQLEEQRVRKKLETRLATRLKELRLVEKRIDKTRNTIKEVVERQSGHGAENISKAKEEIETCLKEPLKISLVKYDPKEDFTVSFNNSLLSTLPNFVTMDAISHSEMVELCPLDTSYSPFEIRSPGQMFSSENMETFEVDSKSVEPALKKATFPEDRLPFYTMTRLKEEVVKLSKLTDPENFFVTIYSDAKKVNEMQKMIDNWCCNIYQHPPSPEIATPGTKVLVYSSYHRKWSRASLLAIHDSNERKKLAKNKYKNVMASSLARNKKTADVELIDYGGTERVPFSNIRRQFDEAFDPERFPPLALKCSLNKLKPRLDEWNDKALEAFKKYCSDKRLWLIVLDIVSDTHYVDIMHYEVEDVSIKISSLCQYLMWIGEARPMVGETDVIRFPSEPVQNYKKPIFLHIGDTHHVIVTEIASPDLFYVTLLENQDHIQLLQKKLKVYFDLPDECYFSYVPKRRSPCVVLDDGAFYRGSVVNIVSADKVKVEFIDFGRQKVVSTNSLRIVRDEFLTMVPQAIPCKLTNVTPAAGFKWPSEAIDKFRDLVFECEEFCQFIMNVEEIDDSYKAVVNLRRVTKTQLNISTALIECGLAKSLSKMIKNEDDDDVLIISEHVTSEVFDERVLKVKLQSYDVSGYNILRDVVERNKKALCSKFDSTIRVLVSHWQSPSSFCVQIASPEVKSYFSLFETRLYSENVALIKQQPPEKSSPLESGTICIFYHPDSSYSYWRRGVILERLEDFEGPTIDALNTLYNVRAKDYGFTATITRNNIRVLPSQSPFLKDDDFCIQSHLSDIMPAGGGDWTRTAIDHFEFLLKKYKNNLYIAVNCDLPEETMPSVPVDMYVRETALLHAFAPVQTKYRSVANLLILKGAAIPDRQTTVIEDEENPENTEEKQQEQPVSFKSDSIISYLKEGYHKINLDQACKVLYYKEPARPSEESFIAQVCDISEDIKLWFRLISSESPTPLAQINKTITQVLREKDSLAPIHGEVFPGRACSAYYQADSTWNRAEIVGKHSSSIVAVRFVDYGNFEYVQEDFISSDVFNLEIPKLALSGVLANCKLKKGPNMKKLRQALFELLVDKKCIMSWVNFKSSSEMKLSITLPDSNNLLKTLVEMNLVEEDFSDISDIPDEMEEILETIDKSDYLVKDINFQSGYPYPIVVTSAFIYTSFFFQTFPVENSTSSDEQEISKRQKIFLQALDEMRKEVDTFPTRNIYLFAPGDACCALYTDDEWYRGLILKDDPPTANVRRVLFVDYGNVERVFCKNLRELPDKYIRDIPIHSYPGKLHNIKPDLYGRSINKTLKKMQKELENHSENLLGIFHNKSKPWEVEIHLADPENRRQPLRKIFQQMIDDHEVALYASSPSA